MLVAALCVSPPVDGPVVRPFAPEGRYAGHWGVDFAVERGSPVHAVAGGTVTFAGEVAGVATVTIDHGGGVKTSYSYLASLSVEPGERASPGAVVGMSGIDHGLAALHLSVRVRGRYVDPMGWLRCTHPPALARLIPLAS